MLLIKDRLAISRYAHGGKHVSWVGQRPRPDGFHFWSEDHLTEVVDRIILVVNQDY